MTVDGTGPTDGRPSDQGPGLCGKARHPGRDSPISCAVSSGGPRARRLPRHPDRSADHPSGRLARPGRDRRQSESWWTPAGSLTEASVGEGLRPGRIAPHRGALPGLRRRLPHSRRRRHLRPHAYQTLYRGCVPLLAASRERHQAHERPRIVNLVGSTQLDGLVDEWHSLSDAFFAENPEDPVALTSPARRYCVGDGWVVFLG
jgi:hypothetical protein